MTYDCYCDYDTPDFYRKEIRKARKPYRCEECAGPIKPGERYEHVTGSWDHYISTYRTCERCYDLRVWITNNVPCFCWAHGGMFEEARDAIDSAAFRAPEETVGLRFGYLRRLFLSDRHNRLAGAH